ncbi:MAG: menaquinone biosynthesis protein [Planctomycetota bacterium]
MSNDPHTPEPLAGVSIDHRDVPVRRAGTSSPSHRSTMPVIGAVSYLNTKPLIAGLDAESDSYRLDLDLPSRLADRLSAGELSVGLIPVIEAIQDPIYVIVSDACIACRGPVWSVKLMSRVPLNQIQTLALDEGSRTSQALTKILLAKKYNATPECHLLSMQDDWRSVSSDAALIIGDRAMNASDDQFPFVVDLGDAWFKWTGLPFVFAVWAARFDADHGTLDNILTQSRDFGITQLDRLADENRQTYSLSQQDCRQYLNQYIHYHLGDKEKRAMKAYFEFAVELDMIPNQQGLTFYQS